MYPVNFRPDDADDIIAQKNRDRRMERFRKNPDPSGVLPIDVQDFSDAGCLGELFDASLWQGHERALSGLLSSVTPDLGARILATCPAVATLIGTPNSAVRTQTIDIAGIDKGAAGGKSR